MKKIKFPFYKQNIFLFSFIIFCLFLLACTSDKSSAPTPLSNASNCDTVRYKYNNNVKSIISSNCLGCHGTGSANGDLSTYTNVSAYALSGALMGSLKGQGYTQMPPAGKLSDCDIKGIENWVIAGANND